MEEGGYEISHAEAMRLHRRRLVCKRWRKAFQKVASRRYQAVIEKDPKDEANSGRALYRMGALHFYESEWTEAAEWLEKACKLKSRRKDFRCLRMCGQAHMRCFGLDGKHESLEKAQKRLYKALKLMPVGIESYVTLPHALMELADLYERYGAFEGALDIMGRVTEFFPSYGKYEEVMHRCVVVMHHLANLPGSMTQTLMARAVEFLDVLMVERPRGLGVHPLAQRSDVLLLYARCCELEGGRENKQKAQATYEQLFKKRTEDGEPDAMIHPNWRKWVGDPATLLALGREQAELGEPTVAAALFDQGVELISERMPRYLKMGITDPIGFDTFIVIANCYASFQDIETALHYAKQAYQMREFDPSVRALLSGWSDEYDLLFKTQLEATLGVQHHWRKRIWSQDYYQRYYAISVDQWERELKDDYWNLALRAKLAYFCKRKWRMVFLFEDATAARIQKWKHDVEAMRHWRAAMREAHLKRCAALYGKWKRHQYDIEIRAECLELAQHRKTPPTHKLCELKDLFEEQVEAVVKLQGQYQRLLAYRRVQLLKEAHQVELKLKRAAGAITIQCGLRCHWARIEVAKRRVHLENGKNLAVILQRTYRHRRGIWAQMKKMADEARAIRIAEERRVAVTKLQCIWRGYVDRYTVVKLWPIRALAIQRLWRGFTARRDIWLYKEAMATRLQRCWREKVERERWESLLRRLLEAKNAPPAPLSNSLTRRLKENRAKNSGDSDDSFSIDNAFPQLMPWKKARQTHSGALVHDSNIEEDSEDNLLMRAPESDSAGQGSYVAASDDVGYLPEEWILPKYRSPGLPGTPAWSEAIRTTELTFVAADYQLSLSHNPMATKFEEAIGSDNKQSNTKEDISQGRTSLEVDDLKGERTAAPEEDSEEERKRDMPEEVETSSSISREEIAKREQERRDKVDWRASMSLRGGIDPSEAHRQKMLSGDAYFGTADGMMLAGLLRHQNCRLEKIVLLGADLADHDAGVQVSTALSTNRTLRTLVLGGCRLHADSIAALATALKSHNFSLRELYLDANPIGEALGEGGVGRLMEGVVADYFASQFGALHTLSLSKMGLDDTDTEALGRGLGGCVEGHLHRLYLGDNFISDEGALALLRGLRHSNKMMAGRQQDSQQAAVERNKSLSPMKRTHESLSVRLNSGERGLREVDLSNNRITDIAAIPWLEHVRDDLHVGTLSGIMLADFTRRGPRIGTSSPLQHLGSNIDEESATLDNTLMQEKADGDDGKVRRYSVRSNDSNRSTASKNSHWGGLHPHRAIQPEHWPAWMDEGAAGSGGSFLRLALAGNLIKDSVFPLWNDAVMSNPCCEVDLHSNMFRQEQDAQYTGAAAMTAEVRQRARCARAKQRHREETAAVAKVSGGIPSRLQNVDDSTQIKNSTSASEDEQTDKEGRHSLSTPDEVKARRRRGWRRMGVAAGSKTRQQRRAEEKQAIRQKNRDKVDAGLGDLGVHNALARIADWSDSEDEDDDENEEDLTSSVRLPRLSPEKRPKDARKKKAPSLGMLIASSGNEKKWEHPDEARAKELARPRLMQGFEPHRDFGPDVLPPPGKWEDVVGPVLVDRSPDKAHSSDFNHSVDDSSTVDPDDEEAMARVAHRRSIREAGSPAALGGDIYGGTEKYGKFSGSDHASGGLEAEVHNRNPPTKMHGPSLLPTTTKFTAERMAVVSTRIMRTQKLDKLSRKTRRHKIDDATSTLHARYVLPDDPKWRERAGGGSSSAEKALKASPSKVRSQHTQVMRYYEEGANLPIGVISPFGGSAELRRLSDGIKASPSKPIKTDTKKAFEDLLFRDNRPNTTDSDEFTGFIHDEEHSRNGALFHPQRSRARPGV